MFRAAALSPIVRLGGLLALAVFAADRASKWWMLEVADMPMRGIIEVTDFLNAVMVWNRGVSFGLLNNGGDLWRWGLIMLAVAIVLALVRWLRHAASRWVGAAIGLVIGGAMGNIYDRISYGAVADFIDLHVMGYHWPAFNLADSAITMGVIILLIDALTPDGGGADGGPTV